MGSWTSERFSKRAISFERSSSKDVFFAAVTAELVVVATVGVVEVGDPVVAVALEVLGFSLIESCERPMRTTAYSSSKEEEEEDVVVVVVKEDTVVAVEASDPDVD